jgi:N-acetylglucosaminyldiphosphoundecaprenol N-acetyl-beta-D-mannosaminyltransferase
MSARRDPELLEALRSSDLLIPDGIGAVIGMKVGCGKKIRRTTGVGLMTKILGLAAEQNHGVFLFGAKPDVNITAVKNIQDRFPSLLIAGTQHGYLPRDEHDRLVEKISGSRAEILFVGLGSPKQEKWIHRHRKKLNVKICLGVGGSFDVWAGKVALAPRWVQKAGLEWLYRLAKEPKRLKRQMVLPKFILAVFKQRILTGKK